MTHLLKLEIRKFRLPRKMIAAFLATAFCMLFITVSLADSMTDPEQTKDTFESTFLLTGLLVSFVFLIYSSILTSALVINEYSQRTITILFSYPLNKRLLIAIKMMLIMAFTAVSILFGYVCCCGYIVGMDHAFDMLEGSFQTAYLSQWVSMAVTSAIVCGILSWWPFVIGMIRKSVPATIVTSLIVLLARQLIITKNPANQENLFQIVFVLMVTLAAVTIVFREKVTKID